MIEFKVTGENAEEFARNALQAWGVLATGLQQLVQQQMQAAPVQASQTSKPGESLTAGSSQPVQPVQPVQQMQTVPVDAGQGTTAPASPEPVPAVSVTASAATEQQKQFKPEEIKSRLAEVITAAAARGWAPARRNAYAKQLLAFFRATGVSGIPTARYEEFMALSASYVTGTVNELLSDEIPF